MDIFLMILAVIGGAIVVGAAVLLFLRLLSSEEAQAREDRLTDIAEALGGELGRSGLMGSETVTIRTGDIVAKIMLVQHISQYQNRYMTYLTFDAPTQTPFGELFLQTTGIVPQRALAPRLPPKIGNPSTGLPSGLEFYSTNPHSAHQILGSRQFQSFLSKLVDMTGLAKFELLLAGREFKFAIEGFLLEKKPLIDLYELLLSFVQDRRQ